MCQEKCDFGKKNTQRKSELLFGIVQLNDILSKKKKKINNNNNMSTTNYKLLQYLRVK